MTDTIFALSSGSPPAAIAVVRVSGPDAHEVVERVAGPLPPPRQLALRSVRDADGDLLDRGLVAVFPAETSVTGEPLAELHLHGGRATVDAVSAALVAAGLRPARAGEFTMRAFRNGRMDLIEVESLSDLLRAETEGQRRAAIAEQGLSREVERWRREVLMLSALVEAALDQSDEDDVPPDRSRIDVLATQLVQEMGVMLARPSAERLFDGLRVVFAGPPNSGKSTLINVLAQRDVAITSPTPGTTRDVIEAPVKLGGIAFILTDTAGLRDATGDAIEREGIERAQRRIAGADLMIWMDDESEPPNGVEAIHIHPRADEPGREVSPAGRLRISAVSGDGVTPLIEAVIGFAQRVLPREGEVALTRRQRVHVQHCFEYLSAFCAENDELVAAEHLRQARRSLDDLTGRSGTEDMLDALFATFCVGK